MTMQKLKCISLYQPYASLCVIGAKRFETRGWDTNVRGLVGIHATKAMPDWCKDLAATSRCYKALCKGNVDPDNLPTGMILGTVEIVNTHRTDVWLAERMTDGAIDREWQDEYEFGDYDGGRFAWELANPVMFEVPIPAKGSQGFWFYDGLTPAHDGSFLRK